MTSPVRETPASQSPPAVLTAAQRHDLARQFGEVQRLVHRSRPDFRGAHQLLSEICTLDPGNTHFVTALLENLQRAAGKTVSAWFWLVWKMRAELQQAIQRKEWTKALRTGWSLLGEVPGDAEVLRELAQICESLDHGPTQIVLLRSARKFAPKNPAVLRPLALALCAAGQFTEAAETWQQLRQEIPDDADAPKYLRILRPGKQRPATTSSDLIERVRQLLGTELWDEAEQLLAKEAGAVGASLELRRLGEDISIKRAFERYLIAIELDRFRPTARIGQLVDELHDELNRIELGVAFARHERFPTDPETIGYLAHCLTAVGNYSEALKYLQRMPLDAKFGVGVLVATAENWQRLRQFDRALTAYREAFAGPDSQLTVDCALLHQGAVLAEAMGEHATAIAWLERVVAVEPGYKDASARLDNLRSICHKGGFPAGQSSHGD